MENVTGKALWVFAKSLRSSRIRSGSRSSHMARVRWGFPPERRSGDEKPLVLSMLQVLLTVFSVSPSRKRQMSQARDTSSAYR